MRQERKIKVRVGRERQINIQSRELDVLCCFTECASDCYFAKSCSFWA